MTKTSCLFYLLFALLISSCNHKEDTQIHLLQQAQQQVEDYPEEALKLLDSIPYPEEMDKNHYMQYIVTKTQAKYRAYQDIRKDTLIFEACKYFDAKDTPYQSALAHYYTAAVYHENQEPYKELENNLRCKDYAEKAGNDLLQAKNYQCIANIYYKRELLDSAITYLEKSLIYYNKLPDIKIYKLEVIRALGICYEVTDNLDKAAHYLDMGLSLAKKTNNKAYEITFIHLIGVLFTKEKRYAKASDYLYQAFSRTTKENERRRIALGLLRLNNELNQIDSAKIYAHILEDNLDKISYIYTLRDSYVELSEYYSKLNDYQKAYYYLNLQRNADLEINESLNVEKLAEIQHQNQTTIKKQDIDRIHERNVLHMIMGGLIFLIILFAIYFRSYRLKERNRLLKAQLETQEARITSSQLIIEQQNRSLDYMHQAYQNIITDWRSIDREVKKLSKEYGAEETPPLYKRIRNLIDKFKQNTNTQLIEHAKDYFQRQPYGSKLLSSLENNDLLLFMLFHMGYKRSEIALLLNVNPNRQNMEYRKHDLKSKLLRGGMPEAEVNLILFKDNE